MLSAKNIDQRVRVHRNVRTGRWVVYQHGKKVGETASIILQDVDFRVQPAGHRKAVEQGQRNVHAFAYGTLTNFSEMPFILNLQDPNVEEVTYYYKEMPYFFNKQTKQAIHKAEYVVGNQGGMYAIR